MKTINSFRSKLLALTFTLMAGVSSFAYDFQSGYLFYNILPDRTVAVTSETYGIPYDYLPTSLVIPSEVSDYYGAKYQVSEIANYAFQGCDKLESLVIPNTVKKIGIYAFTGCSKLLNISFPESLEDVMAGALYECAWYDNQPDGLVYVGNLLYRYKGIAPTGVITINEGTKAVLGLAFSNQPNITSVILPESVTSVHMQAFGDCPNLESVTLPTWLSVIEDYTFQNCSKLQNINLPLGLEKIGKEAFAGCSSLTNLEWPLQLKSIGVHAFYNCNNLDGIENISPNIERIGTDAFRNTTWESKQTGGYLYIHNVFYAYTGEVTDSMHIEIKKGTTYISGGAVSRCAAKINEYSTENVVSKITIPNSVTEIEDGTFRHCRNLDTIICTSVEPPVISKNTFNLTLQKNKHVLLLPTEALDIYKWVGLLPYQAAPYWNNFTNVKPITDPHVYDPMYFEKDSIQYHITNDTLAPYEVEVTHWYGLELWEMEGHNYPELTTANIPATVTYKGTTYLVTRIGKMAFYHASQLQRVTIGENVKTIDEQAFAVCRNLSQVVIGENVDSILLNAFASGTSKIKILDIPKNVKFIENKSLSAYSLEAINVHPDNANYTSVDGVLFNKQKNYLQEFPRSKATTYMIPDCVDTIGNLAFASNHNIVSISFSPNSQLKHIEKEAFMGCVFMQRLELPTSLQSIEERAFNSCSSLEAITSLNPTPPVMSNWYSFNEQVFGSVSHDIPLFVPAESVELYDAAPQWDRFATILPIGTITMNDFPTLAGLQRTSFNAYMGSSLFSAETNIRYIKDKAYLNFQGFFLREENNQVLIYSRRLAKDLILYDYSLEVGDTLTTLNFDYRHEDIPLTDLVVDFPFTDLYDIYHPIDTLIVTDISYVKLLDDKEYKKWTFNNGMEYVEGIGSFGNRQWSGDFFQLIANRDVPTSLQGEHLVCASRNGKLLYQMDEEEMERLGAECLCDAENPKELFPTLWGLQRTSFYHYTECSDSYSSLTASNEIVTINDKPYLRFGKLFLREANNQVLIYSAAYDKDLVLYDWNLEVGDSISLLAMDYGVYPEYAVSVVDYRVIVDINENGDLVMDTIPTDKVVVDEISTITLLDGKEYKTWHLATEWAGGITYVEGIGILSERYGGGDYFGLIRPEELPTCYYGDLLVCITRDNKLLYQMDDAEMERLGVECLCDYDRGPRKDNAKNGKIGGRPTPTQWNQLELDLREGENGNAILSAETFSYTLENDSIVANNKTFYQLARQSTKDTATTKYSVGALHFGEDEDNRVYFLRDGHEYVLYDFTAEPGDTIEIFAGINNYPQETTYTHVVVDKDTTEDGACRMFLEVVFPDKTTTATNTEKVWLAGLGSIDGIVHNAAERTSDALDAPARSAHSNDTQTSIMLCAWRDDNCLYTTHHPDYDTLGCVYNQDGETSVENIPMPDSCDTQKFLRNGQLLIIHEGKTYNVLGVQIK